MAKVYLSSTLLDLKAERQSVTDWLIAAGFQPVHSYVASSETVRDSCLDDIADCDLYILIIGHRYGYQPKQDNPDRLSITHLEFNHARELKRPCLAFLRTSVPDIQFSDLNDPERSRLIHAFRAEVAEALRPAEFNDKTEFVTAFSAAIVQHVMRQLKARDTEAPSGEQRLAEHEDELRKTRESAVSRVLAEAGQSHADDLAKRARAALLQGDTALAVQLLRQKEGQAVAAMKPDEAAELAREIAGIAKGQDSLAALAALERALSYKPDDFWTWHDLGDIQQVLGRNEAALRTYHTALALAEKLARRQPDGSRGHRQARGCQWHCHLGIGAVLSSQGDLRGALSAYMEGLTIARALADMAPADFMRQMDLSFSYLKVAQVFEATGDMTLATWYYKLFAATSDAMQALPRPGPSGTN
jgi:tetratricopeptide (TPR) repeat protein